MPLLLLASSFHVQFAAHRSLLHHPPDSMIRQLPSLEVTPQKATGNITKVILSVPCTIYIVSYIYLAAEWNTHSFNPHIPRSLGGPTTFSHYVQMICIWLSLSSDGHYKPFQFCLSFK